MSIEVDVTKQVSTSSVDTQASAVEVTNVSKQKSQEDYRNYLEGNPVAEFYYNNHINQTFESVMEKKKRFVENRKLKYSIMDCARRLNEIVDESDPDTRKPQIYHLVQTGERARKLYPELRWLHLVGFIHDLGKILLHNDLFGEPQWCTVGDTFPVGCAFHEKNVYFKYFEGNPDSNNPKYNTKFGIYEPNCGFDNVHFSWSHDEYMYQVLKGNCLIPEEGLYIIRYHSFYPWHQSFAYDYLANEKDHEFKKYLNMFQVCDLYSKVEEEINVEEALKYYEELIKEFIPNDSELLW